MHVLALHLYTLLFLPSTPTFRLQETSIVDATPGTTADVKTALMELHDIGPSKLFDTAGVDEEGERDGGARRGWDPPWCCPCV